MDNSPIGVFDSGMGGLSVWRELRKALPDESIVYYGDGAHCPYGEKPADEVSGYIDEAVRTLLGAGAKLIVLACNTATMIAVKRLRAAYPVPFVGMEPAIKPAAATTRSGIIGVLATRASIGSDWFGELSGKYAAGVRVLPAVGEGFVEAVERGEENTPAVQQLVHRAVGPLVEAGADRIVLGCTHYPFLKEVIAEAAGAAVEVIDPAPAIARRAASLLDRNGLRAAPGHVPHYTFLSAAGAPYADRLRERAARL
ncbi:MAG TPA: glutamate racemase [Candidatus Tidjanibacter gallistercoris]|nr:glutamate racemase [Candidatus Tidjanibacter gallistercoris]